jgi:hypothetical protein
MYANTIVTAPTTASLLIQLTDKAGAYHCGAFGVIVSDERVDV